MTLKCLLLVGGKGLRLGSPLPKQFLNLAGKKIYLHTLDAFLANPEFEEILLVAPPEYHAIIRAELNDPRIRIIEGGKTRQESAYRGLLACGEETEFVVIHDAVRPLISHEIIAANIAAVKEHGAVDTCIPSTDTIAHSRDGKVLDSIPKRSEYLRGQTPQSFAYSLILEAHEKSNQENPTDDCTLALLAGYPVHVVPGSEENIKITTELDLTLAEQLLRGRHTLGGTERSIAGKTYAITGGTGGIGSALATLLEEQGATPLLLSRKSKCHPVDLRNYYETEALFAKLGPLDGLINCVGHLQLGNFDTLTLEEIDQLIETNLTAPLYACRCAEVNPGGHILNLASSSYSRGRKGYALYSAAKAALVNFTQALAEERPDLHVHPVIPQRTDTPMRRENFPGENPASLLSPRRVAELLLYLLKHQGSSGALHEIRATLSPQI